ncbi:MAG TPA: PHP-associated domain-containing protein [Candidatus Limnocylindrales bacterium]|nr:PHP-associated domain-containing protein [Candidatus Limnocylindrales bacterium]
MHTHSVSSPDGGITPDQYAAALDSNLLDLIAVTDHNQVDFALGLQQRLGERIIVGEEIMTTGGEIIGLYLNTLVRPGLSPEETVQRIKDQGGMVYVPHPFESVRHGLHPSVLEELAEHIDIMEVCNGRAFLQNRSAQAVIWAKLNRVIGAASSDAHGARGLGKTYTRVPELPQKDDLLKALSHGIPVTDHPGVRALLYPKYHMLRKKIKGSRS